MPLDQFPKDDRPYRVDWTKVAIWSALIVNGMLLIGFIGWTALSLASLSLGGL